MRLPGGRQRWAMGFAVLGMLLMGVDLLMTRNFFVHIAELMAASIFCFVCALLLDRGSNRARQGESD
ncbi:hypothetical protein JCM30471_14390 [Desulfuromonas carbonis]